MHGTARHGTYCRSCVGFQFTSKMMTFEATARLRPSPPALVEMRKRVLLESRWNCSITALRSTVDPSSRT